MLIESGLHQISNNPTTCGEHAKNHTINMFLFTKICLRES